MQQVQAPTNKTEQDIRTEKVAQDSQTAPSQAPSPSSKPSYKSHFIGETCRANIKIAACSTSVETGTRLFFATEIAKETGALLIVFLQTVRTHERMSNACLATQQMPVMDANASCHLDPTVGINKRAARRRELFRRGESLLAASPSPVGARAIKEVTEIFGDGLFRLGAHVMQDNLAFGTPCPWLAVRAYGEDGGLSGSGLIRFKMLTGKRLRNLEVKA